MESTCVTLFDSEGRERMYGIVEVAKSADEEGRLMDREISLAIVSGIDVTGIKFETVNW